MTSLSVYPRPALLAANSGTLRTLHAGHNHKYLNFQKRIHRSLLVSIHLLCPHLFRMKTMVQMISTTHMTSLCRAQTQTNSYHWTRGGSNSMASFWFLVIEWASQRVRPFPVIYSDESWAEESWARPPYSKQSSNLVLICQCVVHPLDEHWPRTALILWSKALVSK